MVDLKEKVVLITGGSRGIGAVTVGTVARAGAHVILHYGRSRERAESLADDIGRDRCHLIAADLESASAGVELWRAAVAWQGRVDVLVNNAGIYEPAGVDDDLAAWHRVWARALRVNLTAAADLCREAIRHYRTRGGGIIVNIASRAAFRGDDLEYMHYAASKAGLVALTRSIARGFAREGVLAYVVAPGFVKTEMADPFVRDHGEEAVVAEIPLGAMADPEDVANVVAFLASGAARHATGTTIDVNGASYVH